MFAATPDLEHVPTVEELWAKGLADPVAWTQAKKATPTHFRIRPAGQQLIYDAMARNARKAREYDERQRQARVRGEAAGAGPLDLDDGLPY